MSQTEDQRSHFLQLKKKYGGLDPAELRPAPVGRRERAVEADRGGPDARQADATVANLGELDCDLLPKIPAKIK